MRAVGLYCGYIQYAIEYRGWFGLWWRWRGVCSPNKAKVEQLLNELRIQEEWDWWQLEESRVAGKCLPQLPPQSTE